MKTELFINDASYALELSSSRTLLSVLREELGLTSTRFGCGYGACGACYVLLDGQPAPACKLLAGELGGRAVRTIEGLATGGSLHERRPQLQRAWCAVDAGEIIWPDGARNQIEGAIQQAASWALLEQLAHSDGQVRAATWHDYPIATALDAPESLEVIFSDSHAPPTGIGEPGAVAVAAAIANAIYDATGIRMRSLPLDKPLT
jgi:Molybdopterin-binding domain of aldehyde dehydrogenase/2Fe-2S iron-sulfur cluster binding domain